MTDQAAEEEPVRCTCGLPLTAAESRARGLGRICYERLHGKPPPTPRRPRTAAAKPGDGQAELPIQDQLELELWSP